MFISTLTQADHDCKNSPERPVSAQQQSTVGSLANSPPNSEPAVTTIERQSPPATDENALLAAQLATTVAVVVDTEERPSLSYKDLIIEAIESSPERRLKLSEIYQVIKYLHPYYKKRNDQWGWQNSIRHNLSLHDCFVKLPLKQTSASGVVGHFWTVVREAEEKQNSTRRKSRNNNGPRLTRCSSGKVASSMPKVKGRQSVSSDSGVMSDESQSHSPTVILLDGTSVKKGTLTTTNGSQQLSSVASAPQLHRPVPSYIEDPQRQAEQPVNHPNLSAAMALNSLLGTPAAVTPGSESLLFLGHYTDLASSVLMNSNFLARATNNNTQPSITAGEISSIASLNDPVNLERLQLLNSSLYQNSFAHQALNQSHLFEQQQQNQATLLINQLLTLKAQLAKPPSNLSLFMPPQILSTTQPTMNLNGLQQNLLHLLSQKLLNSNPLISSSNSINVPDSEPSDPRTKNENNLVV